MKNPIIAVALAGAALVVANIHHGAQAAPVAVHELKLTREHVAEAQELGVLDKCNIFVNKNCTIAREFVPAESAAVVTVALK